VKAIRSLIVLSSATLVAAFAAQPSQAPSPLLKALNSLAQRQLMERAEAIAAIRDRNAAEQRKAEVRRRILSLVGGLPEHRGPLNARTLKTLPRDGFVIEHVIYESLPEYFVTANLYRPDRPGRHPAVLMSMGHWESGKASGQLLAANLARKGFVVLVYDPVGQGERQQAFDPRFGRSLIGGATEQHFNNGAAAILMGQALGRYFIHDGMRGIDYLVSRSEVDAERIGAMGCSGGGTQTTYIAALDPRVKVAAPACYMNSFQTLFAGSIGDSEQSVPGFLAAGLDQTDYVELFAPKPWLIASTEDDFFTPAGAKQVYEEAQRWYKLYGAEDRIQWVVGPGGHGTPLKVREAIYAWMIRWLRDGSGDAREEPIQLLPDHELRVTETGQIHGRELYEIIREVPRQRASASELATFIRDLTSRNQALVRNFQILPAQSSTDKRPAVVVLQDRLAPGPEAQMLLADKHVVVIVALSGAGSDVERPRSGNWMNNTRAWLVGRNLPALHAAEINAAVSEAATRPDVDPARISGRASGVLGVAMLLAAAANPQIGSVTLDRTPHSLRAAIDAPIHTDLHDAVIPGFAVKWDLVDLRTLIEGRGSRGSLLEPRTVVWKDPTDWMGNVVQVSGKYTYTSSDPNTTR